MRCPTKLKEYDAALRKDRGLKILAGFDEAGRGPLCGPVACAGCILPDDFSCEYVDDSKKLTKNEREKAAVLIKEKALAYAVAFVSPATIDKIDILEASRLGMEICLERLRQKIGVDLCVTDYMDLRTDLPVLKLAHGDATSQCVAAASVLAKTSRDAFMAEADRIYPGYGFARHEGYPTKAHLAYLAEKGLIPGFYRLTYRPVRKIAETKGENAEAVPFIVPKEWY